MVHRLSHIAARTGDDGTTGLGDGSRIPKDTLRIEALGTVDELNCALGVLLATPLPDDRAHPSLSEVQHDLFDLGGELAIPGSSQLQAARVNWLEGQVAQFNHGLPPLKEFVLPGGGSAAAQSHVARAICRRAERSCWGLARTEQVRIEPMHYLNRLSDLLFVLARTFARAERGGQPLWNPGDAEDPSS